MKEIDIVIATRNRFEKLDKTIDSILNQRTPGHLADINIHIIFDGDKEGYEILNKIYYPGEGAIYSCILSPDHIGSVAARNLITPFVQDGLIWATDDITFSPGSIESAFKSFNEHFPDDDGVVGFIQEGVPNFHPTGVGLMGQKFLQRYPGKKPFFPGYYHFSCQEIYWLAMKYNKFYQDPNAKLFHYHPCFHKELVDQTHIDARVRKVEDMRLIKEREAKGLIWGDSNDIIEM